MDNLDAVLRAADRAAAAPFTETPRIPGWYPVAIAAYLTAVAGTIPLMRDGHILLGAGLFVVAVVAVLTLTLILRSTWGTWPRLAAAPTEVKRAYGLFTILAIAAFVLSAVIWTLLGDIAGLMTVLLTTLVVVWAYEYRLYPAAAQQVRQRLA